MDPGKFFRYSDLQCSLVEILLHLPHPLKLCQVVLSSFLVQYVSTFYCARLDILRALVHHQALDGGDVVQIRKWSVPGTHFIVALGAVPVPLTEYHDRCLHFNDQSSHLEGG